MTSSSSSDSHHAVSNKAASTTGSSRNHHPVRSPSDRHTSRSKSQSPSPERSRKRPSSSRGLNGHGIVKTANGHDESEAETEILSDDVDKSKTKIKKRLVKNEPKDDVDSSSVTVKAKSEHVRSNAASRASSVNGEGADKKERKPNGSRNRENGHSKAALKEKLRLSNDFSAKSSRAQSADASSPVEPSDRPRQVHSAEPRKRKFSDAGAPRSSKLEPPRQRPRLDDPRFSKPQQKRRPSSPLTPGTPSLRSHRRSASTQSNILSAGLTSQPRKTREVSSNSAPPHDKDWRSDMSSDEAGSFPLMPILAPPPRSGRMTYRAQTSPVRVAPTGKRADRYGTTPLARACEKGLFKAAKIAYEEAPGEINQTDHGGFAPLQKAALGGFTDIVKFLLEKGCSKDCCSKVEQDTPLIDAVENGHVEVIRLLLDHGVNPHHQNKSGKRAIDAVPTDDEDADEIREMLLKAMADYVASDSDDDDDNQEVATIREEDKNRTDLLYLEPNSQNLLDYAQRGDVVAVDHFLSSVKPGVKHAVVAARGGHDLVLNLLLASAGDYLEKDPDPTKHEETPLLAAIGRGHLKIIRLLLDQDNFNPTRKTREGKTYWEVAEERRGPRWQTEKDLLKEHYDAFVAKRKVQKRKKIKAAEKREASEKQTIKEPSSSPQAVKQKKVVRKPAPAVPEAKEAKRKHRPVLESSDSEDSDDEVRVAKKPMRKRQSSFVSRSSKDEQPTSPMTSRQSSGSKSRPPGDVKSTKESNKEKSKSLRKPSSEKRLSTDSRISATSSVKAQTPESVREARQAEQEAKAEARAAKAAEAERLKREAEEAAAKEAAQEAARKAEEERLRLEEEERVRKEKEEQEKLLREEQARKAEEERIENERRIAALPNALRVAVQKGAARPLHFRPATKDHPEELGIGMQFLPIQTTALRNIDSECDEQQRDELWMMNFQVVGILGLPSELRMLEFPTWDKKPVSSLQRELFLQTYDLSKLAQVFRWPQAGEASYRPGHVEAAMRETREKFLEMQPLMWVRYADLLGVLGRGEYKHLEGLKLKTCNCRIGEEEVDSAVDVDLSFEDEDEQEESRKGKVEVVT